jgi:hypothetical protein
LGRGLPYAPVCGVKWEKEGELFHTTSRTRDFQGILHPLVPDVVEKRVDALRVELFALFNFQYGEDL